MAARRNVPIIIALVVCTYCIWMLGRKHGEQSVLQSNGWLGSNDTDLNMHEELDDSEVNTGADENERYAMIGNLDNFCKRCSLPQNECSVACTDPKLIRMCTDLNRYAHYPRLPCPPKGWSSSGIFRSDPFWGIQPSSAPK